MYIIISPRRILMVSTMVLTFTAGLGIWDKKVEAGAGAPPSLHESVNTQDGPVSAKDHFLQTLGASSDEAVYDALLEGQSLADIASLHQTDAEQIVTLQVDELTAQLDARLAEGSIRPEQYRAYKAELTDIVRKSVYGGTSS
ncbi:hypothetical protein PAESOLCIP111_00344 [Paenibacillus solanacearum]|uniref:SHOCT domain-containing protein n=1 Tax=Paenibacillus solanacearum TaxID=2048548 RepID=A0A916NFQ3_9BACL|nr:hypothetical protein [Paenibacillus solanacearum]CAG7599840.1 hypothetical protein PAESOLCIP111_00344 [Paenibacillus solanacearum]